MISITSNIGEVAARLSGRLAAIERGKDQMIRTICTSLVPIIKERIHEKGEYSDGTPFGGYNPQYLRLRERAGRLEGNKKVFSLTGKLENALTVVPNGTSYAIGVIDLVEDEAKTIPKLKPIKSKPKKRTPKIKAAKKLITTSQLVGFIQENNDSESRTVWGLQDSEREVIQESAKTYIQSIP